MLARATLEWSGRRVTGFAGPLEQVSAARAALGLTDAKATLHSAEVLMSLQLDAAVRPAHSLFFGASASWLIAAAASARASLFAASSLRSL